MLLKSLKVRDYNGYHIFNQLGVLTGIQLNSGQKLQCPLNGLLIFGCLYLKGDFRVLQTFIWQLQIDDHIHFKHKCRVLLLAHVFEETLVRMIKFSLDHNQPWNPSALHSDKYLYDLLFPYSHLYIL